MNINIHKLTQIPFKVEQMVVYRDYIIVLSIDGNLYKIILEE